MKGNCETSSLFFKKVAKINMYSTVIIYHELIVRVRTREEEPRRPGKHLGQRMGRGMCLIPPGLLEWVRYSAVNTSSVPPHPACPSAMRAAAHCPPRSREGEQERECALPARAARLWGHTGHRGACIPLVPPAPHVPCWDIAAAGSERQQLPAGHSCWEGPPWPPGCGVRRRPARVPALSISSAKSILSLMVLPALGLGLHVLFE